MHYLLSIMSVEELEALFYDLDYVVVDIMDILGDVDGLEFFQLQPRQYQRVITNIEELYYFGAFAIGERHFQTDDRFIIYRTYRLPFDAPSVIRLDSFELSGLYFEAQDITKLAGDGITSITHSILVEHISPTSALNSILPMFSRAISWEYNGYMGVLELDESSIEIIPAQSQWERFYFFETRIYPNVSFGDVSSFAVSFTQNVFSEQNQQSLPVVFSIYDIDWQPVQDFLNIESANDALHNAIVTYRGWYSLMDIPYFTTRATYTGELLNFDYFPSILYEVQFVASLEQNGELSQQGGLLEQYNGESEQESTYTATEQPYQPLIEISTPAGGINFIPIIIVVFVLFAGFMAFKFGWLDGILVKLKLKKSIDDESDIYDADGED